MSNDHDIKTLNSLIETVIDSADGYTEASKAAQGSRFEEIFRRRGAERQQLTTELQGKVRSLGGEPESDGTLLAGAHRLFLNLRNSMSSDDTTIVDQVEAGEDHIKHKFEDAQRDKELSPATRADIDRAYLIVKAGHDEIRDLKHALHASG
ncbi:PA2169 family four-helix-bundle protein [Sphingomonas abietis]|uniref:PA2169 family four-helix-bundle protein n=1 Tax=Sphingomonas abietis TaxID=3012344 RepID=A0ABY7NLR8_9SPHN|nr:PA2169 family four-helix-bundle protein [Sphingomonas abietis]WBO21517.1 PA2169 family four-helix-bundle protein [Sphingomonas abietis]